jgi:hypothetical protein
MQIRLLLTRPWSVDSCDPNLTRQMVPPEKEKQSQPSQLILVNPALQKSSAEEISRSLSPWFEAMDDEPTGQAAAGAEEE